MRPGLLLSFAHRWRDAGTLLLGNGRLVDPCDVVPYDSFVTGRIPTTEEYDFPYMSLIPGNGRPVYRSDKNVGVRRIVAVHIWCDPSRLEEDGELAAELVRLVYSDQAWTYGYGMVNDVLDGGPPIARQINEPSFQAWELVRLLTLCIEQPRVDSAICGPGSVASSSGSQSGSYGRLAQVNT